MLRPNWQNGGNCWSAKIEKLKTMKAKFLLLLFIFTISCSKDIDLETSISKPDSHVDNFSNSENNDCLYKIKGSLKNEKHRQLIKKYYDQNV
jgi:hypothetical protein